MLELTFFYRVIKSEDEIIKGKGQLAIIQRWDQKHILDSNNHKLRTNRQVPQFYTDTPHPTLKHTISFESYNGDPQIPRYLVPQKKESEFIRYIPPKHSQMERLNSNRLGGEESR